MKKPTAWILGLVTAALLYMAFPKIDQGWLSLIGLVPWLLVIYSSAGLRTKLAVTFVAFLLFFGVSLEWIRFATMLGYPFLAVYKTLYAVVICLLIWALGTKLVPTPFMRKWLPVIATPVLWTASEWARCYVISGMPWILLGHTLHDYPMAQAADIIGVLGLTFLIVAVNSGLATLLASSFGVRRETGGSILLDRLYLALCLALMASCSAYGVARLREHPEGPTLRVGVVQANAGKDVRRDSDKAVSLADHHIELSRTLGQCDVMVWPETSIPVKIEKYPNIIKKLSAFARERNVYLVVGGNGSQGEEQIFNSAFFVDPSGDFLARYDKIHLVPFGEYVPLPGILEPIVRPRVHYKTEFTAGTEPVIFKIGDVGFSCLICYEDVFPELIRDAKNAGSRLLMNMTSEGWFGTGAELEQHLAIAQMQCIQYRIPMVRSTNTGISAYIDPMGRVTRSDKLVEDTAAVDVFTVIVPR